MINAFLDNQWVITIVGAVISGVIMIPLTIGITRLIDKNKMIAKGKRANEEVLRTLSKIVSEGELITLEKVEIISNSFSRKIGVPRKFMNSKTMMIEDLISDIYQTNYIPMKQKNAIVSILEPLIDRSEVVGIEKLQRENKWKLIRLIIIAIAMVLNVLMIVYLFVNGKAALSQTSFFKNNDWAFVVIPVIVVLVSFLISDNKDMKKSGTLAQIADFFGLADDDMYEYEEVVKRKKRN